MLMKWKCGSESHSVVSHSLWPHGIVPGILQARILEWVAISCSRGIFQTQGSNPGLPHCRQMLSPSEPPEKSYLWYRSNSQTRATWYFLIIMKTDASFSKPPLKLMVIFLEFRLQDVNITFRGRYICYRTIGTLCWNQLFFKPHCLYLRSDNIIYFSGRTALSFGKIL